MELVPLIPFKRKILMLMLRQDEIDKQAAKLKKALPHNMCHN